jgi:hypothetical protein
VHFRKACMTTWLDSSLQELSDCPVHVWIHNSMSHFNCNVKTIEMFYCS